MAEKEIQVMDFLKNSKPYDAYKKADIDAIENSLQNDELTPMERRKLEKIYKNCLFLQAHSFDEKTRFLDEDTRRRLRQRRLEEMKQEKEKTLHFRKLIVRAGIIALLATGSGIGYKVYHDTKIKPIEFVNENYAFVVKEITIKDGQTLTSIAKEIYDNLPDDVKKIKTVKSLKDELVRMNGLKDENLIIRGQTLYIPSYELKDKSNNIKNY